MDGQWSGESSSTAISSRSAKDESRMESRHSRTKPWTAWTGTITLRNGMNRGYLPL
jgi:hypothetical protein